MFAVAGVTGNTGSVVADTLLAKGKKVRVIVRDAKKGESWKAKGAEVALADIDDSASLAKALTGTDGAFLLSPPDFGAKDFLAERRKTVDSIASAIDASHVPFVVFLSSYGSQHETGTGLIRTTAYAEQRLAKTSAKLAFVRAGYFMENWASVLEAAKGGVLPTFLNPEQTIPMVATKDIGATAANALLEGTSGVIELAGPRDYTANEIGKVLEGVTGKKITVQAAPIEAVVPALTGLGASQNIAELYREMIEGIANGKVEYERNGRFVRGTVTAEQFFTAALK